MCENPAKGKCKCNKEKKKKWGDDGIKIGEAQLKVDLVVMQLQDFELIWGMVWLEEYRVTMNCFTQGIMADFPWQPCVMFHRGE